MQLNIIIPDRLLTIDNFFSPEECAAHIRRSEGEGYEAATISTRGGAVMNTEIRNNDRLIADDPDLALKLWERVQPFVPSPLFGREAIGLNERVIIVTSRARRSSRIKTAVFGATTARKAR